jgi:CHAD domain-containing protein
MSQPQPILLSPAGAGNAVISVIDDLQQHLQRPEGGPGYIHRIRVDIKHLRAWLRMIRKDARFDWRACDRRLRDISRRLSPSRDSQVVLDTLAWLQKKADTGQQQALDLLRSRMRFDLGGERIDWPAIKVPLAETVEALREPAAELDSDAVLNRGLKNCYKRATREGRRAFGRDGSLEDLHELRKWVKYLYYQIGYVCKTRTGEYEKDRDLFDELGDRLGRIHDLELVSEKVAQLAAGEDCAAAADVTLDLVRDRMDRLLRRCRRLYEKGFSLSPSKFIRRLA